MSNQIKASPAFQLNLPFDSLSTGKEQGKLYKNKNWLHQKYIVEQLSMTEISKLYDLHPSSIERWLNKFNIKTRSHSEAIKLIRKKKFWGMPKIKRKRMTCEFCGKIYWILPSELNYQKRRTCSRKCRYELRKKENRIIKKCKNCGKKFWAYKSQIGRQHFCNKKCNNEFMVGKNASRPWSQIKRICEICGEIFYVSKYRVEEGLGRFCSQECMHKWRSQMWKENGHPHYKPEIHIEFNCNYCGKLIKARKSERPRKKFCSRKCNALWMLRESMLRRGAPKSFPERIIDEMTPDYICYTGNGEVWKTLKDGTLVNPDFKVTGQRKFMEIYGDYWHRNDNPYDLIYQYAEIDYECLVIWEHEIKNDLDDVLRRVNDFVSPWKRENEVFLDF